ncbi:MAG: hypothetical protein FD174_581 [Geobacteraceae bacterium]|nr:MAG: hypothetical protein FD174_581 [Geobacteraceae bacterium]
MRRIIAMTALTLFVTGVALAEETMVLPGKQAGDVPFTHQKHTEALKSCQPCHSSESGGKIEGFGKESAHKLCKDCHVQKEAGPTTCSGCHKK